MCLLSYILVLDVVISPGAIMLFYVYKRTAKPLGESPIQPGDGITKNQQWWRAEQPPQKEDG